MEGTNSVNCELWGARRTDKRPKVDGIFFFLFSKNLQASQRSLYEDFLPFFPIFSFYLVDLFCVFWTFCVCTVFAGDASEHKEQFTKMQPLEARLLSSAPGNGVGGVSDIMQEQDFRLLNFFLSVIFLFSGDGATTGRRAT